MSREQRIIDIIKQKFNPIELIINNQSALHRHHSGDDGTNQTHFDIYMVSSFFDNMSRVNRHREVSNALKEEFDTGLHALSLSLKTPSEIS